MAEKEIPKQLPEAVAAKYSLKPGFAVGTYYFRTKRIELDKISVEQAEDIVNKGFDVLVLKKQNTVSKEDKK